MTIESLVAAPKPAVIAPTSRPGSILSIARVQEGIPWDLEGMIDSFNCLGFEVDELDCAAFTGMTKRFDAPSFGDGALFGIQSGMTCKPFGFRGDDPRLRQAFEAKEPEAVSVGLHDFLFDTATDATPTAGAVTPIQALGLLEGIGWQEYAGQAVIHAGPILLAYWAAGQALRRVGDHIETLSGTPVAVAAGYETKTSGKLDPDQWAYVTGEVALWRSEVVSGNQLNRSTNEVSVLFERLYAAAIDCLIAKVKVTVLG